MGCVSDVLIEGNNMRKCDNCDLEMVVSTYNSVETVRLSENLNLSVTLFIEGRADICRNCMRKAALESAIVARRSLAGLLEDETEGSS